MGVPAEPAIQDSRGQEMVTFVSEETRSLSGNGVSVSGSTSSVSESSYAALDAPPVHDVTSRSSAGNSSESSSPHASSSNRNPSGINIFQGYSTPRTFLAKLLLLLLSLAGMVLICGPLSRITFLQYFSQEMRAEERINRDFEVFSIPDFYRGKGKG